MVDEQDSNIFSLFCKLFECGFDGVVLSFLVHDEEVFLRVWRRVDMLVYEVSSEAVVMGL